MSRYYRLRTLDEQVVDCCEDTDLLLTANHDVLPFHYDDMDLVEDPDDVLRMFVVARGERVAIIESVYRR